MSRFQWQIQDFENEIVDYGSGLRGKLQQGLEACGSLRGKAFQETEVWGQSRKL